VTAPVPDIEAIRAAEQAATPAPWFKEEQGFTDQRGDRFITAPYHELDISEPDADLIVLARNSLPALLAEVTRLRGLVAAQERQIEAVRALHQPEYDHEGADTGPFCSTCHPLLEHWPCPTIAALGLSPGVAGEQESEPPRRRDFDRQDGSTYAEITRTVEISPATRCGHDCGYRPSWMSPGQYDECWCVMGPNHEGDHKCEHDVADNEKAKAYEASRPVAVSGTGEQG
jgi:hypothetical protein